MHKKIRKMLSHIVAGTEVFGASLVPVVTIDETDYFVLFKRNYGQGKGTFAPLGGNAKCGETGVQAACREAYEETSGYLVVHPEDVFHLALPGHWPTYFARTTCTLNEFSLHLNHEHSDCKFVETNLQAIFRDADLSNRTRRQLYDYVQRKRSAA